jgi:hypothetical protein
LMAFASPGAGGWSGAEDGQGNQQEAGQAGRIRHGHR